MPDTYFHPDFFRLLHQWVALRSRGGFIAGVLARMSRPDWCGLTPGRRGEDEGSEIEEMGWCFLELPSGGGATGSQKRDAIWSSCHGEEKIKWLRTGETSLRPSKRRLRAILLELQQIARTRGLIPTDSEESE